MRMITKASRLSLPVRLCQVLFKFFHAEGEGLAKEVMESKQYTVSNFWLAPPIHSYPSHPPLTPHSHPLPLYAPSLPAPPRCAGLQDDGHRQSHPEVLPDFGRLPVRGSRYQGHRHCDGWVHEREASCGVET